MRNNYCEPSAGAGGAGADGAGADGAGAGGAGAASCRVRGALALTLRMSRSLGIAPVTLESDSRGGCVARLAAEPNYYGYFLLSIIHVCLLSAVILDLTAADKRNGRLGTVFEATKWLLQLCFLGFIATVGVLGARARVETIISCMSIIEKIHCRETDGRGLSAEEKKRCVVFVLGTLTILLPFVGYYMLSELSERESEQVQILFRRISFLYVFLVVEVWVSLALEMQFVFVALTVNSALSALNDSVDMILYIIDMQTSPCFPTTKTGLPETKHVPVVRINAAVDNLNANTKVTEKAQAKSCVPRMVSQLIINYGQIGEVIQKVNASFEMLLLALYGSYLFFLVVEPHNLIICLYEKASFPTIALMLFNIALQVVQTIMGAEPGSKIEIEMHRTRLLVCQLLSRGPRCEPAVARQLDLLYQQVQLDEASFSPMGVCLLNRRLVLEIFAAASTLLTIILQYRVLNRYSE